MRAEPSAIRFVLLGLLALLMSPGGLLAQSGAVLAQPAAAPEPDTAAPIEFPASLSPKLSGLTAEQMEFVRSKSKTRSFARTPELLIQNLEKRTPAEVKAYVEAMMWVTSQRPFQPGRDRANIPMNTAAPDYNAWQVRRPRSFDPEREPGPVDLGRYVGGGSGIPTFAGAPVALTPEDLIAGKVDVAIVGAPLNMGSGWRGAQHGPLAVRTQGAMGGNDQYVQVNANTELNIVDYGDVAMDNNSTERSMQHTRAIVREIAQAGAIPFIIGGDHSLEYPNVAALVDVHGKGNVTVIHFDAHYDVNGRDKTHLIDHGQPIYRLMQDSLIKGSDYIQVGLRAGGPDEETYKWMREQGFRYHPMAEIEKYGWDYVLDKVMGEARALGRKLHISFDVDVLDPSFIPGTGTPVSGGLTPREAIPIVRRLCAENDIAGFDLVEVAPELDPTYVTTRHSSTIAKACLTGIAMRRKGLTEPHYLNPVTLDHAQDPQRTTETPPQPNTTPTPGSGQGGPGSGPGGGGTR